MPVPINHKALYYAAHKKFGYIPETGELCSRETLRRYTAEPDAYIRVSLDGKAYQAHRIIWLMVYGYMTENVIDHINGDPQDNRLENLREVSRSCNTINSKVRCNSETKITGVSWAKHANKWRACISPDGKQKHLGYFSCFDMAVYERFKAERKYSFLDCQTRSSAEQYVLDHNLLDRI